MIKNLLNKNRLNKCQSGGCKDTSKKNSIKSHLNDLWNFISNTRKISVPIIMTLYTAIVVLIVLSAEYAYDTFSAKKNEQVSIEEILSAQEEKRFLEREVETEVYGTAKILYKDFKFKNKVTAQNADEYAYVYENNTENSTYLDLVFEYKNLSSTPVRANKAIAMNAQIDGIQYTSFCAIETDGNTNIDLASNTDIEPNETAILHFIFDVPKMHEKSDIPIIAQATICNDDYTITIR